MQHYNTSITEDMNRLLNLKGSESTQEINDVIQPTINIIPNIDVVRWIDSATTIYTTPTDKDFYLTNALIGMSKGVAHTGALTRIDVTIKGVVQRLIFIPSETGIIHQSIISEKYDPIKIDRGTNIIVVNSGTFGIVYAGIKGYTRETTKS